MPIPSPNKDENQQEFVSRCMSNSTMVSEYPDKKQRAAVCFNKWEKRKKSIEEIVKSTLKALKGDCGCRK